MFLVQFKTFHCFSTWDSKVGKDGKLCTNMKEIEKNASNSKDNQIKVEHKLEKEETGPANLN